MKDTSETRIRRALRGEPVDRPPISFWAHNFARENSAEDLAAETVRAWRRYGWDFIKIQSRASSFAEMWGSHYQPSTQVAVPPTLLEWPVHTAADLAAVRPVDPTSGALGEQLDALRAIRAAVGPHVPILQTVFAPTMVLTYLVDGPEQLRRYLTEAPAATKTALAALAETLAGYAQASLEHGADGIFYAIKAADGDLLTRDQYAEFGLPYDVPALAAANGGWLNLLHLCGDRLYFEVVDDLPSAFVSYALSPHNPSLAAGRDRARRAVIGGVSPKPQIREMTPAQIAAQVNAALEETGGVQMMIGPGCSISPDTPEANLDAANRALADWAARHPIRK